MNEIEECGICGEDAVVFPPNCGRPLCKNCYESEIKDFNEMIPDFMADRKLVSIFAKN